MFLLVGVRDNDGEDRGRYFATVVFESCSVTLMRSGNIVRCQMHQLERSLFNIYAAIPPDT